MLNLIDSHQLDIYNIPISFITGQYMDYLAKAKEIDLNLSGDFLVMAGTLLAIKAKMLLPRREKDPESGEAEEDPRDELVTKLFRIPSVQGKCSDLKGIGDKPFPYLFPFRK